MKLIYLVKAIDENITYYKIGRTNNIEKRLKNLSTGNHLKLELLYEFESNYSNRVEYHLHLKFKDKKIKGEWFNLDENDVINFIEICNKTEKMVEILKNNHFYNKYIR